MQNQPVFLPLIIGVLVITNLISFFLMGKDKKAAEKHTWRIPEKTLFLACACFGGLGGVLGMKVFRHKTRHRSFQIFFPTLLILQIGILIFLFGKLYGLF